jgi:hypothetical protein
MDKFNRAVRRHHVARLKHKRKHYWGWPNRYKQAFDDLPRTPVEMPPRILGQVVNTTQLCSCLGCGNQRHNTAGWTPTIQEKRWLVQYREQLDEAEEDHATSSLCQRVRTYD